MSRWESPHTDEQREALALAYLDHGIRPARRVVELAKVGELPARIAPFTPSGGEQYVREQARAVRRRRAGLVATENAKKPPRDALEALRIRLVSAVEYELARVEKAQKKAGPVDPMRLQQLAKALREVGAIPAPGDEGPKPKSQAQKVGGRTGQQDPSSLAGRILADSEQVAPSQAPPHTPREQEGERVNPGLHEVDGGEGEASPGAYVRAQLSAESPPSLALVAPPQPGQGHTTNTG